MTRWVVALGALIALAAAAVPAAAGDDPYQSSQWALSVVGAPAAWATATGAGVTVAVVDSGVDLAHEDLAGRISAHVSCVGADGDPEGCSGAGLDDNGHGTHVAGIAAATTGNGRGVASVAPGADLMAVKVLEGGSGYASDVRAGIEWAVDHGADVINLSLGAEISLLNLLGSPLEEAINAAWARGVIPVVAAGNDQLFPTGYHGVDALVVTATDRDDEQASYASSVNGAEWALAAPGGDGAADAGQILSTWWSTSGSNQYGYAAGTSMAAPHVAGAAALLLSLGLSPAAVVDRLLATAVDLGPVGDDSQFGAGRLDVAAAVQGLGPGAETSPTAGSTGSASGSGVLSEGLEPDGTLPDGVVDEVLGGVRAPNAGARSPAAPPPAPAGPVEAPPASAGPVGLASDSEADAASADDEGGAGALPVVVMVGALALAAGAAAGVRRLRAAR